MKLKNYLWALALVAFVGCSSSDDPEPTPTPTPTPTPPEEVSNLQKHAEDDEVKVMSFNVRLNTTEDNYRNEWFYRKEAVIEVIEDHKPSVIGFQEAEYTDQWIYIKSALEKDYDGWGVDRKNGEENPENGETMGILYDKAKVKKIDGGTFWLSGTPDQPSKGWDAACERTATWGIFEHIATGKKFCYINTHLDHKGTTARIEGMKLIVKKFKEYNPDGYVQFLTGDLNVKANHEALDVLKDYMVNTRSAAPKDKTDNDRTYNGFSTSGGSVIDHIYCTKGMEVVEYHTIDENYGSAEYVSDHYPIYAIIKMK
ncbi:MAG: endonuclease/exonuclease/phosphatase family protein [Alistipes sp.]|nr:endonuclease/exonuclease/phosphatase family protein [Alistipes sp.]MBP3600848.1 endonuclease/exonuclease/phosphatase family protein [Alistipes sp.]